MMYAGLAGTHQITNAGLAATLSQRFLELKESAAPQNSQKTLPATFVEGLNGRLENCISGVRPPLLHGNRKHSLPAGQIRFVSLYSTAPTGDLERRFWRVYWRRSRHNFNYTVPRRLPMPFLTKFCSARTLPTRTVTLKEVR